MEQDCNKIIIYRLAVILANITGYIKSPKQPIDSLLKSIRILVKVTPYKINIKNLTLCPYFNDKNRKYNTKITHSQ